VSIIQGHEDKMNKKPQAKTTRTSEGSQGSAPVTIEGLLEGSEQTNLTDAFDQFLYSTLSTMAKPEFLQNYASRQGDGSKNYLVKFAKIGNLHDIMTKIVRTYFPPGGDSSADMKLLLSTILTSLITALHGLVNPDFISRPKSKDWTFFLGQHRFRYTVEKGKAPR
jgi:hypothetical protein